MAVRGVAWAVALARSHTKAMHALRLREYPTLTWVDPNLHSAHDPLQPTSRHNPTLSLTSPVTEQLDTHPYLSPSSGMPFRPVEWRAHAHPPPPPSFLQQGPQPNPCRVHPTTAVHTSRFSSPTRTLLADIMIPLTTTRQLSLS